MSDLLDKITGGDVIGFEKEVKSTLSQISHELVDEKRNGFTVSIKATNDKE